jgi:hypothetical protein
MCGGLAGTIKLVFCTIKIEPRMAGYKIAVHKKRANKVPSIKGDC